MSDVLPETAKKMAMEIDDGARKKKGRGFKDRLELDDERGGGKYESLEGSGTGTGPAKSIEGWIVIVTGVHDEAQEEDIHEAFAEFGEVKNCHMNLDRRSGFVKGYALIEYESKKEAEQAIEEMNGKELLGKQVSVDWAFSQGPKKVGRR